MPPGLGVRAYMSREDREKKHILFPTIIQRKTGRKKKTR